MELLYAPGLGYYSAGAHKFGPGEDFTTAPERSPLFAACVADALSPAIRQAGKARCSWKLGGGNGAFAEACLEHLQANGALPARYAILEQMPTCAGASASACRRGWRRPCSPAWVAGAAGATAWDGDAVRQQGDRRAAPARFVVRGGEMLENTWRWMAKAGSCAGGRPIPLLVAQVLGSKRSCRGHSPTATAAGVGACRTRC